MQHLKKQLHIVPLILFLFTTFMYAPHLSAQKKSNKKTSKNKTEQSITLTSNGHSLYSIVTPTHATASELKAATVLQDYLLQISGTVLPVIESNKYKSPYEIVLGQNERLDELSPGINYNLLKQ